MAAGNIQWIGAVDYKRSRIQGGCMCHPHTHTLFNPPPITAIDKWISRLYGRWENSMDWSSELQTSADPGGVGVTPPFQPLSTNGLVASMAAGKTQMIGAVDYKRSRIQGGCMCHPHTHTLFNPPPPP